MIRERLRSSTQAIRVPIARVLGRLGFSPNALTVFGYLLNLVVLYILATGRMRLGGLLAALAGVFDALDGALARETGQTSAFGAFFDSFTDRYSEATVFLGLLWWYLHQEAALEVTLVYVAIVGSFMVSYARARAEGLGISCKTGLLTRFERLAVLTVGLIAQQVTPALWIIAILANATAVQRAYHVWRAASRDGSSLGPRQP